MNTCSLPLLKRLQERVGSCILYRSSRLAMLSSFLTKCHKGLRDGGHGKGKRGTDKPKELKMPWGDVCISIFRVFYFLWPKPPTILPLICITVCCLLMQRQKKYLMTFLSVAADGFVDIFKICCSDFVSSWCIVPQYCITHFFKDGIGRRSKNCAIGTLCI